jgi:hypothetical protein
MILVDPVYRTPLGKLYRTMAFGTLAQPDDMECGRCGATHWQEQQWRPDIDPTRYIRRCYVCGWSSGWLRFGVEPMT